MTKDTKLSLKNWIDGKWVSSSEQLDVVDKSNGELFGKIHIAKAEHVEAAIESSLKAKRSMRSLSAHERATILLNVSDKIESNKEHLAIQISRESGKALKFSRMEIDRSVSTLRISAEEAKRLHGEVINMDAVESGSGNFGYWKREAIGIVLAITPFNFPLNLVLHKVGPAIAAGNAVILKPAENAPFSAGCLAELFAEAGLPVGGLNILHGPGERLGPLLTPRPEINKITFTGSRAVGEKIVKDAGIKKVTLELGNASPVIVTESADLEKAAQQCAVGAFYNSGQVCISVQRVYVAESCYSSFLEKLIHYTKKLVVGDPLNDKTDVGPMISTEALSRAKSWIQEACDGGAVIEFGGTSERNVLCPTILSHCPDDAKVNCQEVFAPLLVLQSYKKTDEAIQKANQSDYGLQASIFSESMRETLDMIDALEYGGVMVNKTPNFRLDHMPYGGVKQSGIGREGPRYAIEDMTEIKMVVIDRS